MKPRTTVDTTSTAPARDEMSTSRLPLLSEAQNVILTAYFDRIEDYFEKITKATDQTNPKHLKGLCAWIIAATNTEPTKYARLIKPLVKNNPEAVKILTEINQVCNGQIVDLEPSRLRSGLLDPKIHYIKVPDEDVMKASGKVIAGKVIALVQESYPLLSQQIHQERAVKIATSKPSRL